MVEIAGPFYSGLVEPGQSPPIQRPAAASADASEDFAGVAAALPEGVTAADGSEFSAAEAPAVPASAGEPVGNEGPAAPAVVSEVADAGAAVELVEGPPRRGGGVRPMRSTTCATTYLQTDIRPTRLM